MTEEAGSSSHPDEQNHVSQQATERITRQGIWWNLLLTVVKGSVALISGSKALLADAFESASDILVSVGVLISLKVAGQPVDYDHPYGHGKVESVVAQIIGLVLFVAASGILYIGIINTINPPTQAPSIIALYAALLTIVVKEILFRYTLRVGKRTNSPAVIANAWGHRSDAYSSIVTVAGVGGALLGLPILDPIAAAFVSLFIYRMGVNIVRESTYELMDGLPDRQLLQEISQIAENVPGVDHAHEIKGRRAGRNILIDLTLEMNPDMSLQHSHQIAHEVKRAVREKHPDVANVMIHINPHVHPHTHRHEI